MDWFSQFSDHLWQTWAYVTTGRVMATVLGIGFAILAIALLIASRTKWGQAKPLTKCVVVSVLLHVWLLMYALGSRTILPQGDLAGREQSISVSFDESPSPPPRVSQPDSDGSEETADATTKPWQQPASIDDLPKPPELANLSLDSDLSAASLLPALLPALQPTPMPALPPPEILADLQEPEPTSEESATYDSSAEARSQSPTIEPVDHALDPPLVPQAQAAQMFATESNRMPDVASSVPDVRSVASKSSPVLPPEVQLPDQSTLPREYQLRQAPNRLDLSRAFGADADSEAAVKAGLEWLVGAQSTDGSWNAQQFGAGTETNALGEYRHGTGGKADTGVSGLALLAFLSAGHTHQMGEHQQTVLRGLEYMLDAQMPSGDLSGPKQVGHAPDVINARMYCHSIATLALAEAYAMTLDVQLRDALLRAAQYSIKAQDVRGGGWRYRPGDAGDLSQFGWHAMALKSVERSGIQIPVEVKRRMRRFLDSCAAGRAGGLARYRPREGRPSDTMTAEALACRLLLGYPLSLQAQHEATNMIMTSRPGEVEDNVYFWYYATLALFQLQDENWRVWNQAMKARLITSQVPSYRDEAGSWDPDSLWGGYGGRVYSTAISCMCLEVYYRYLPMYQRSNLARTPRENVYSR